MIITGEGHEEEEGWPNSYSYLGAAELGGGGDYLSIQISGSK